MPRFISTIILAVFAVRSDAVCTVEQYQGLLSSYAAAQANVPQDGSVTTGEDYYNIIAGSFSDEQKQLTCLSCMRTYTIDLFNLSASSTCTDSSKAAECQTAMTNTMNTFVSCSMETTKSARVMLSGAASVLVFAAALIL